MRLLILDLYILTMYSIPATAPSVHGAHCGAQTSFVPPTHAVVFIIAKYTGVHGHHIGLSCLIAHTCS